MTTGGQKLGRYELLEKIGSGGMADIYRAKFSGVAGFEKTVAIKKILPYWSSNDEFVGMLVEEAKILVQLSHPNIVQVFELNREGDDHFIVMEFVDGIDLRTLANRLAAEGKILPVDISLFLLLRVCAGLQYAHEKKDRQAKPLGIVHRDISPQNILLSADGEVKIADFGIARILGRSAETVTGTLKGKFSYMSPEQALGKKVDAQTDIYALGILLYELLSGERLFKGSNDLETLDAVRNGVIVFSPPAEARIPQTLKAIILRALKKERGERYASVAELSKALDDWRAASGLRAGADDLKRCIASVFPEKFRLKPPEGETTLKHPITLVEPRKTRIVGASGKEWRVSRWRSFLFPAGFTVILFLVIAGILVARVVFRKENQKPPETVAETAQPISPPQVVVGPAPVVPEDKQPEPVSEKTAVSAKPSHFEASLTVTTIPADSSMTLTHDGRTETVTGRATFRGLLVKPETFLVSASREGYSPVQREITLSPENPEHRSEVTLAEVRFGALSVAARPWGKVYLKDLVSGAETPFAAEKIPVGEHALRVVFPPTSRAVSAAVTIREGVTARCQAVFGASPSIKCQ